MLVGGLAVHYLTRRDASHLPGAVKMDGDFGITLGTSGGQYGTIKSDLSGLDFVSEGSRLVRKFGNLNLYLDFLTEDPPAITGARVVDDVVANVIPGINRALADRRLVTVEARGFLRRAPEMPGGNSGYRAIARVKAERIRWPYGAKTSEGRIRYLAGSNGLRRWPRGGDWGFSCRGDHWEHSLRVRSYGFAKRLPRLKSGRSRSGC